MCRLRIKGMACTSCSESVERALSMANGVKRAVVGLALEEAKIHFDPTVTDTSHIIEAVEDSGFGAELITTGSDVNKVHLKLEGVDHSEDFAAVQNALEFVEGVSNVEINFSEKRVVITYDPDVTGPRSLIRCIEESSRSPAHYNATLYVPLGRRESEQQKEVRMYRNQFLLSCFFSVPVFIFSMILPMIYPYGDWLEYKIHDMLSIGMILRWFFCTPVQFIVGKRYTISPLHEAYLSYIGLGQS